MWLLNGILDHEFSWVALKTVREKYKRLGLVLEGYNQPDLWLVKLPKPSLRSKN